MQINKWFNEDEFRCNDNASTPAPYIDMELVDILTAVREFFGLPVTITNSYRTPEHNKAVGGAEHSQHLYINGHAAADIKVKGTRSEEVYAFIDATYPTSLGLGKYSTFVHVDTRDGYGRWTGNY